MVETPENIFEQLGLEEEMNRDLLNLVNTTFPAGVTVIKKGQPIFPRLEVEEEVSYIKAQMSGSNQDKQESLSVTDPDWNPEEVELVYAETEYVEFDQFIQAEMKVAEVIDVEPVKGSNKLLRFRLDAGDKGHRQILSGIAKHYPDCKALVGKKVTIVANLKPRKMMGYISQGMILSAESDGKLHLLFAPDQAENGSLIG